MSEKDTVPVGSVFYCSSWPLIGRPGRDVLVPKGEREGGWEVRGRLGERRSGGKTVRPTLVSKNLVETPGTPGCLPEFLPQVYGRF